MFDRRGMVLSSTDDQKIGRQTRIEVAIDVKVVLQ